MVREVPSGTPRFRYPPSTFLPERRALIVAFILAIAAAPIAALWLLPLVADVASVCRSGWARRRARALMDAGDRPGRTPLLFLVPAHNESLLIEACARSLMAMRRGRSDYDVYVIADNCTDDTAAIASATGVGVLKRFDLERRGKPYAIEWALTRLPIDRYDAVVIIDADTVVDPDFADALAAAGPLRDKAVQAYFGVSNEHDSWLSLLAGLLTRVRYEGQYLLKRRTGLNCPLTGNGMCLGTALLARAGWAPDSLTENWELYARYTALGEAIEFAPNARLWSQEARTLAQSGTQRRRWQAGRWGVFRRYGWRILRSGRIGWRQKADALAELASPGPVLHAALAVSAGLLLAALPSVAARVVAAVFALSIVPTLFWTGRAWLRHPDRLTVARAFARLPVYVLWRTWVAVLAFSTGRRGVWQRSPRHIPDAA